MHHGRVTSIKRAKATRYSEWLIASGALAVKLEDNLEVSLEAQGDQKGQRAFAVCSTRYSLTIKPEQTPREGQMPPLETFEGIVLR